MLTAQKSVGVPETWCGAGLGVVRFFADFARDRTILPCTGGTLAASWGHGN